MSAAIDVTYRACVYQDGDTAKLTITRDVRAGICGPWGGMESVGTLAEVEDFLKRTGYSRIEDWKINACGNGLHVEAEVVRL